MTEYCGYCGKALAEKEKCAVRLKDGQAVCADCADKTRILYPFRYAYVLAQSTIASRWTSKNEAIYDNTVQGRRIDPLMEMTLEEFRAAMEESLKAAEAQAARHAGAKAVIEVDHVRRYFVNIGTEGQPKYSKRKLYGVFGRVLSGELIAGAVVSVVFGIYHGNVLQGIYTFLFSILLIAIYEMTGSVWGPVFLHAGFNSSWLVSTLLLAVFGAVGVAGGAAIFLVISAALVFGVFLLTVRGQQHAADGNGDGGNSADHGDLDAPAPEA